MPLTDVACRSAKAEERDRKLTDAAGLHLLVRPNGSKLWRLSYRFAGLQKTLALGSYPEVSLLEARKQRDQAREYVRNGIDPSVRRRETSEAAKVASETTFKMIGDELLARLRSEVAETTHGKIEWLLVKLMYPALGRRPIADISSAECLAVLQHVERSGRLETAGRLRSMMRRVFRHAIVTLRAKSDPTEALKGAIKPPQTKHRPAITDPTAFGRLLVLIDEYDGWPTLTAALQIQALCFTRPFETRTMQWADIDWQAAKWSIPAKIMKMRRPHEVPLSRQAVLVLQRIKEFSGKGELVFPQIRTQSRPLSENAMNSALRRMGVAQVEHCAHGFRTSASTMLNEARFDPDVIETQLAHMDADDVRRAYNRALYWPERVTMMQAWADKCDAMKKL